MRNSNCAAVTLPILSPKIAQNAAQAHLGLVKHLLHQLARCQKWHASPAPPSTCNARDGTSPAASTPRCLDDAWSRQPLTPLFRHHQLEGRLSKPTRITYRARPLPHLGAGPELGIL